MGRMLLVALTITFAALFCSNGASSAEYRQGRAAASGHLYVAVASQTQTYILRFPFVDGVPSKHPDLRYQNLTYPIAVGRDGTLYATVPLPCCYGLGQIDVFPPNSNKVAREITLPYLQQSTTIDTSLVEGPGRYLFIGYSAFISGSQVARSDKVLQGVAVYPSDANGGGNPAQMFGVPNDISGPNALAFDRQGNLYVSATSVDDLHNRVYTVSNPVDDPIIQSRLDMPASNNAYGLEFSDGGSDLYLLSYGPPQSTIAVYPYGASGHAHPVRTIAVSSNLGAAPGLGIAGPNVYVGVYGLPGQVLGFDKHASGSPPPVYTLTLPNLTVLSLVAGR
jgi:hypothetical protein